MNRKGLIFLMVSVISVGCSTLNSESESSLTKPKNGIFYTNEFTQPEECNSLLYQYSSTQIKPELVVYEGSTYKVYPMSQVDEALTEYFSHKKSGQPLVLYVHGRALKNAKQGEYDREPDESKRDVIPAFISKYHIDTTLMLHWPHKKNNTNSGFPEDDAKFAGNALVCVIQRLNSDAFNVKKYRGFRTLITHSMGALVLEEAINKSSEDLHEFDIVGIFSAASEANSSSLWLSKIRANKQYVFINKKDVVLRRVNEKKNSVPLGACDLRCLDENKPVKNVVYLDVTDIAGLFHKRHNYFVKDEVADKVVTKILKGDNPPIGKKGVSDNHRIITKKDI